VREPGGWIGPALACWFLLVTPFLVFLKYYGYPLARPEVALSGGIAALASVALSVALARWQVAATAIYAALITLFADIQFDTLGVPHLAAVFAVACGLLWFIRQHATRVVGSMAATMFVSTLLLPSTTHSASEASSDVATPGAETRPFVLHIVLDEHLALDAFPRETEGEDFARRLLDFFEARGFLVFTRAYSEHYATYRSLSHLMNYASHRFDASLYRPGQGDFEYTVTRNAHFQALAQSGYRIHVYQSNHLNHCTDDVPAVDCTTYNFSNVSAVERTNLSTLAKASLIGSIYTSRTTTYDRLRASYESSRTRLEKWIRLPRWRAKANNIGPIIAMDAMHRLTERLAHARNGEYVYAHLLLPHGPYAFDAACNLLPQSDWLQAYVSRVGRAPVNTVESRAVRYTRYMAQLNCVYTKLGDVLEAIPERIRRDAVIILQGDHGSRITIREPNVATLDQMTPSDFSDSYATLFAVRAPALPPGDRHDIAAVTCLFSSLTRSAFASADDVQACHPPEVYVSGNAGEKARWIAPPAFQWQSP
jgi:hypothetical protein